MNANKTVVGDTLDDIGSKITGVSVFWGVVPAAIISILLLFFFFFLLGIRVSNSIPVEVCDRTRDPEYKGPELYDNKGNNVTPQLKINCRTEQKSGYWKLVLIPLSIVIGTGVGYGVYGLALAEKNRTAAAATTLASWFTTAIIP